MELFLFFFFFTYRFLNVCKCFFFFPSRTIICNVNSKKKKNVSILKISKNTNIITLYYIIIQVLLLLFVIYRRKSYKKCIVQAKFFVGLKKKKNQTLAIQHDRFYRFFYCDSDSATFKINLVNSLTLVERVLNELLSILLFFFF